MWGCSYCKNVKVMIRGIISYYIRWGWNVLLLLQVTLSFYFDHLKYINTPLKFYSKIMRIQWHQKLQNHESAASKYEWNMMSFTNSDLYNSCYSYFCLMPFKKIISTRIDFCTYWNHCNFFLRWTILLQIRKTYVAWKTFIFIKS